MLPVTRLLSVSKRGHREHMGAVSLVVLMAIVAVLTYAERLPEPVRRIGPEALITEVSSGLALEARVDTGAGKCSIHYEELEIEDEADDPKQNIGKRVRFLTCNNQGEASWIEAQIVDHSPIRTPEGTDERYHVELEIRHGDIQETVVVTLNNRAEMNFPFLLGRNFLRDTFVVDVAHAPDESGIAATSGADNRLEEQAVGTASYLPWRVR